MHGAGRATNIIRKLKAEIILIFASPAATQCKLNPSPPLFLQVLVQGFHRDERDLGGAVSVSCPVLRYLPLCLDEEHRGLRGRLGVDRRPRLQAESLGLCSTLHRHLIVGYSTVMGDVTFGFEKSPVGRRQAGGGGNAAYVLTW